MSEQPLRSYERAAELEAEGLTRAEIAMELALADSTVRVYLARAHYEQWAPVPLTFAEQMAAAYPDPERQAWIMRRVAEWEARRR